jgi:hypothetical protein
MVVLDLEQVAHSLNEHTRTLADDGFTVGSLTWRDIGAEWPYPLVDSIAEAVEADSVGITVEGKGLAGRLVVFAGGWADLELLADSWTDVRVEAPTLASESDVVALVARFVGFFGERGASS